MNKDKTISYNLDIRWFRWKFLIRRIVINVFVVEIIIQVAGSDSYL